MSIWVSYGPMTGEPALTAADHDAEGRLTIDVDVAYTSMQEPEVVRLAMSRDSGWDGHACAEMTRDEVRELVKRLEWALEHVDQ